MLELEKKLTMPRQKPKSLAISAGYRLLGILRPIVGRERLLRFFLNRSWMAWRFAFELAGELYGGKFHCHAKALNEDFLKKWIPEGGSVIDIGCGVGRWCRISAKYAKRVVGIDNNTEIISQAKAETTEPNVEYIVGDVTKDLKGEKFDLAIFTHVIEHIDNPDEILQDLRNRTKKLIIEVPDFAHDPLNWLRLEKGLSFYSDGDHVREYTLEILADQLERNGWKVLESYKHGGAVLAVAES